MSEVDPEKTDLILELELAAVVVLKAHPEIAPYAAFRQLFADHLTTVCHFHEGNVEEALVDLDRGQIERPRGVKFTAPTRQTPPQR